MCDQKKKGVDLGDDEDELSVSDDSEPEERPTMAPFDPELDHSDDDDDNEEVCCAPAGLRNQAQFSLRGGSSAFSNRSQSIFDCLDNVARPPSSTSSCPSSSSSSSSSSVNQQKDGVFARPQAPPPSRKTTQPPLSPPNPVKRRGTPDYLLNPERWTHYSLEDTSETSDQGNTRAALSFLSTLQERKEEDRKQKEEAERSCSDSSPCNLQKKMIFSRPSRPKREQPMVRSREKETLLSHLQEEEVEGRETQKAGERRTEVEEKHAENQKKEEEQGQRQREKEEEEEKVESGPVFTSFRRMSSKNYRRSSVKEEY
ncbi:U5 small nuclear ribonucleoprotein TSSC4 [Labrus mixtus]|uniref:U5 small nuclear ribonucleoprotein TSSC4 n=1 Tax=Labrus mixtus TaxID=508554 RepID=UPI0029C015AC|nr:U5 small nuclear ribonucleoprotein TSSC4 [Labrus mixtus]